MTTSVTQVITDVSASRCLDASERTSASVSRALALIRRVILPPSHVAIRVSSAAPVRNRTISSPLPRAHRPILGGGVARLKNIGLLSWPNRRLPAPSGGYGAIQPPA